MKKALKSRWIGATILPFALSLSGCSETQDNRVALYRSEEVTSTVTLYSAKQLQDVTRYDSCMVFVALEGCSYCERTKINLQTYIRENKVVIYEVEATYYKEAYSDESNRVGTFANLYPKLNGYPALLFYSSGKLVNAYFNSAVKYDQLVSVMDTYTTSSNLYMLNDLTYDAGKETHYFVNSEEYEETKMLDTIGYSTQSLDKKISEDGKKMILFTWRRCPDCIDYKNRVLQKFTSENPGVKIYFYETEGYMVGKRNDQEETKRFVSDLWANFSQKYHLVDYSTEDAYGNRSGFVPSIVAFDNDTYQLSVYSNALDIRVNEDGTLSYTKAFYPEILSLKSDTKVKQDDPLADDYQKAKKELVEKRKSLDDTLNLQFLEANIA